MLNRTGLGGQRGRVSPRIAVADGDGKATKYVKTNWQLVKDNK